MILTDKSTVTFLKSDTGEANTPVSVSNSYDLIRKFGLPKTSNYNEWFQIYNYLKYRYSIDVYRPLSVDLTSKRMNVFSDAIPNYGTISDFYNSTVSNIDNISDETDTISYSIVEKYCNSNEDIAVVCISSLSAWKSSLTNEFIDVVLSRTVTDPSTLTPEDGDTYIVPTGAIGDWVSQTTKLAIYDTDTSTWNFVNTSEGGSYYISDEEVEIYKSGSTFTQQSIILNYLVYDDHTYIRVVYNTIQDSSGEILKCYQLMNITPDFDNGEFALFILKMNDYDTFDIVEKHILSSDETAENYYNTMVSNYIYLKVFTADASTNNYSLLNNLIRFDGEHGDLSIVADSDYEATVDVVDFDVYDLVLNTEIGSKQIYIPTATESSSCMCLTGAWHNYDTITDLINEFGIYAETPTGYTAFNRNNCVIGSCKKMYDEYNDKYIYTSMSGDIAGVLLSDKKFIVEATDGFPVIGFQDLISLKENKINIVGTEGINLKQFFSNELYKAKFKYVNNSMIHNQIIKTISEIINNIEGLSRPPLERTKDRIYQEIEPYMDSLVNFDINSYTLTVENGDDNELSIVLNIVYFGVIENIYVNFIGDLRNDNFNFNYKE